MTVRIDPDRCAAVGITPDQVTAVLARSVRRLSFLGGAEDEAGRTAVMLDGRPRGLVSLAETRITPDRPVLLRHVADVDFGTGYLVDIPGDDVARCNPVLSPPSCDASALERP